MTKHDIWTPERVRKADGQEVVAWLVGLECPDLVCDRGTILTVEGQHFGDPNGQPVYLPCESCHGTGLALPGLSRECPDCEERGDYEGWDDECTCREGRVPLEGAELERALREVLDKTTGAWGYQYCPDYNPEQPHEMQIPHSSPKPDDPVDFFAYGPDYQTALAKAVGLLMLERQG